MGALWGESWLCNFALQGQDTELGPTEDTFQLPLPPLGHGNSLGVGALFKCCLTRDSGLWKQHSSLNEIPTAKSLQA